MYIEKQFQNKLKKLNNTQINSNMHVHKNRQIKLIRYAMIPKQNIQV